MASRRDRDAVDLDVPEDQAERRLVPAYGDR
jgi:hypothetical protein